jgi:micrococcal nuclease
MHSFPARGPAVLALTALLFLPLLPPRTPSAEEHPRVRLPHGLVHVDDGDTLSIHWPDGIETVRILGIDTPETFHPEHDLPYAQPFGDVARGFLEGGLAVADEVQLLRSAEKDPYGRTLGYLFLDGKNYSVLVLRAGLAIENVRHFGDNGLPELAEEVLEAADAAPPVPFEAPFRFRARMRKVAEDLRKRGRYPCPPARER